MQNLEGRVAVVTGAGSGIGRGMALAFADAGMHVAIGDIEAAAGAKVADEVRERGVRALALRTDVTSLDAVRELADKTWAEFGAAHVLCNNAGVAHFGPLAENSEADWKWVLGVNVEGVAHGIQVFLPRLLEQGAGHIVNTASLAGIVAAPALGIYTATKYAVVGITETLRAELADSPVSCSVLCPGLVDTAIFTSERNRPDSLGGAAATVLPPEAQALLDADGKDPLEVGRIVRQGVLDDDLYIFSHPEFQGVFEARVSEITAAFEKWRNHAHA